MSTPPCAPPAASGASGAPYRSVDPGRTLAPPPRHVPGRLRTLLYLGGHLPQMAWLFVALGSAMLWIMGSIADWSPLTIHGPYDRYQGEVLRSQVTVNSSKRNSSKSVKVTFRYFVDDTLQEGVSHGDGEGPPVGAKVTIEVPRGHLDQAVVVGMRRRPLPLFALAVPFVFMLVGLGLVGYRVRAGGRELRLLATGRLGQGKLVHREMTRMRINQRNVEKLSFDFEDEHGRVHRAVVRTHHPYKLVDEALEPLVYDPAAPARAALLDALPGTPRIDAAGQLVFDGSPWTLFGAVALPTLALLVNLVGPFVVSALR